MSRVRLAVFAAIFASSAIGTSQAQSLRVSPVTIDLPVSGRSSVISLSNASSKPMQVQARVFRWVQKDGRDVLEKTGDIVASPPVLTISKDAGGIIRLVRVANGPVAGEETYRVLIDEVPSREKLQAGGVAFLVRQSIPVFFAGPDLKPGSVTWRVRKAGGKTFLEAQNLGQKRVRLSKLRATDGQVRQLLSVDGLAGYVLGGQTMSWELPSAAMSPGQTITIEAMTDAGAIHASAAASKSG